MKKIVSSLSPENIDNFKKLLSNNVKVLREGEEGYDEAIRRWSDYAVKKAGMIVQVANLQDIVETIKFARENDLDFAVHGRGNNPSGPSSSEGGIVLDMRQLCNVRVDPEQKLVYAQGGARWKEVNQETHKHGLACVSPCIDDVGVGGFILGGGFGYLTGKHGSSVDNLVGATIVLADGSVKQLSATSNPDLFWGIRGCGFNFGVVYEFVIQAHEHPNNVHAGMLFFPGEKYEEICEKMKELATNIKDDELFEVILKRMPPDFQPMVLVMLFLDSPSSEEFHSRFSAFYSLQPIQDTTREMSYFESNSIYNDAFGVFGDRKLGVSAHLDHPFTNSSIKNSWQSLVDFTDPTKESGKVFVDCVVQYFYYSTKNIKSDSVLPQETRIRNANNVYIGAKWTDDKYDKEAFKWLNQTRESFYDDDTKDRVAFPNSCYPAELDMENVFRPEVVYGKENLERLKELKRKYDPTCFFNKWIPIKI